MSGASWAAITVLVIVMNSIDFADMVALQRAGAWDKAGAMLADAARGLERAGADFIVLCTNLMHKVAEDIEAAITIPFLHIADVVGESAKKTGFTRLGLLGTRWTMEEDFYRLRLKERHGIDVLIPDEEDRVFVDHVIFDELTQGKIDGASRVAYQDIISRLAERGAESVILGCTEIMLLIKPEDTAVPLIDSTKVHAERAVSLALAGA